MKYYAGIGSRETPPEVLERMEKIGGFLARKGYTLRSGGARGADTAFERGADFAKGPKEVWNPRDENIFPHLWATEKASATCWEFPLERMKSFTIQLITRNMYQIFGDDEKDLKPVDFVIYYSPADPSQKGRESGGTRYAVRAALEENIPCFNLRNQAEELALFLKKISP